MRAERQPGKQTTRVLSFDEMRSYVGARHGEKRREAWIWTSVVEEADGRNRGCFEVGDRNEETFSRLPETERYRSDDYVVYGPSAPQPARTGQGQRGEPERGYPFATAGPVAVAAKEDLRVQQERGDAAGFHGPYIPEAGLNLNPSAC